INKYCKTESDLDKSLDKLCKIGYQSVQISGIPLPYDMIHKQLESHGLYCCATHDSLPNLFEGDIQKVIEKQKALECDYVALGCPPDEWHNPKKFLELAKLFNEKSAILAKEGIRLGYHNHNFEFDKHDTPSTLLDLLYSNTDPKTVCAELDLHWVTRGGGSPVVWLNKLAGRTPVIHFKDFLTIEREPHFCEIGEGNMDWQGILTACQNTRVRWYVIEQDEPFKDHDIFDSVKISYDNLKRLGVK
ncbi:MAG: sugar phosphate isomerase/epimerase, partial [Lentisphaeria bacterium]